MYWHHVRALSLVLSMLCVVLGCSVGVLGPWGHPLWCLGGVLLGLVSVLIVFAVMMDRFE